MAILLGAGINSGLVTPFHRYAGLVRVVTFLALGVWLTFSELPSPQGTYKEIYDALAFALLLYLAYVFVQFSNVSFARRQSYERKLLEQKNAVERMHAELREESQRARNLALVAKHANDSVIISDADRRIEWVNPAFSEVTGYGSSEAIGKTLGQLLNGSNTSMEAVDEIKNAIEQKRSIRTEIINYTKSGREIWIETNITPLTTPDGELDKIISVERDITETKKRERELALARIEAEDNAKSKANFLATMSHEIRTPLNGIIGMAELLSRAPISNEQQDYASTILSSGEALLQIINDVLDLSKHEAKGITLVAEPFSVPDCVQSAVKLLEPLAQSKGLEYELNLPTSPLPHLIGDAGRLRQIVLNLVGNAIKFTSEGHVKIALSTKALADRQRVVIEVCDTGIGIAPEARQRIFETFTQAEGDTPHKYGGTGLGLTISQNLARQMGGEISVESRVGKGSVFKLALELDIAETQTQSKALSATKKIKITCLSNKKILVADDNKTNRLLLNKMLGPHAAHIEFAVDGEEAVNLFKKQKPDLILMDISMPKKNGLDATKCIRELEKHRSATTVVIALTANAFETDREECLRAGMNGFMTKPFKLADLAENVAEHMREN
ncbi:ATP-binding protein [Halocynthiibacter sp. C4]|uniref:PAS domain-containing hybrid sensor histidine kinase/response regulator n=1 Tax=Halocynthiibacter sp. C4 TaxID=2992758 RepID=UPI00237B13B3|nr:ATP-binding protein [Halocynthiibacter sp. C4]MDE0591416.1 ATP-binding protein [Halocynthiibacter sp. C4]